MKKFIAICAAYALVFSQLPVIVHAQNRTAMFGIRNAIDYAYGVNRPGAGPGPQALLVDNPTPTVAGASSTLTLMYGTTTAADGTVFSPFQQGFLVPITVGAGTDIETVTPTAIACSTPQVYDSCQVTATFTNAHGRGELVASGSYGLQEALDYQYSLGGGVVNVDSPWSGAGGTNALITAAVPIPGVSIQDTRGGITYWNLQGGATVMTTPTTLTSTTATDATTPAGTWTTSAYAQGYACVDIMGQEGPVSATYAHTPAGLLSSVGFVAPTNCVGAVGYVIYSTLASASYPLAYEIPLVTQPTVIGAAPVSNGVCTLTKLETAVPACATANTTYGQAASNAVVLAIPVNTSPIAPQSTIISTTSVYVPNPNGRTTYTYVPSSRLSLPGITTGTLAYPIGAAAATLVPQVLGEINIGPGFMNYLGRTIEICGEATTTASTATIVDIQFQWDAFGQNTAGKGVQIGDLTATPGVALVAGKATFCADFQTTVVSASATGGSLNHVGGSGAVGGTTLIAGGAFSDAQTAGATASLNLAEAARINVIYVHTTATDGAGWTLQALTAKVIN